MRLFRALRSLRSTIVTLALAGAGYWLALRLAMPAAVLTGPAVAISLAGLVGLRTEIDGRLRDACFVVMGISIGAGFDASAGAAILRWPLAFAALAAGLFGMMATSRSLLRRRFGFDSRSAILASAPGHLSYVMSVATDAGGDVGRIAVVQSLRLLALTLLVPFAALALGFPMTSIAGMGGAPMPVLALAGLWVLGVVMGLGFATLRLPAPLFLGGAAASGLSHLTGAVPGGVPIVVLTPCFLVLGALIGTRFSGMRLSDLRQSLLAGIAVTLIAAGFAAVTAVPIALLLGLPVPHVLVAFAPGGLETMIALGATLNADPGFVGACHIMRLLILTVMVPLLIGRRRTA